MECIKCKEVMYKAHLVGDVSGLDVWLRNKKKGILETEKRSPVSCYVCPACGYVELNADKPQDLMISE